MKIKSIRGPVVIIEAFVQISSSNYNLLEYMIRNGRYNLLSKTDKLSRNMTLVDKELTKEIIIDHETVEEKIRYVIYVPEHIKIINPLVENQII
ncbi:hypothetical protein OAK19_04145 [Aureispira]|nr:hypothetical protein [Aureispira sp.]